MSKSQGKTKIFFICGTLLLLMLLEPASCGIMRVNYKIKGCKKYNADGTSCIKCKPRLALLISQGTCVPRRKVCPDGRQRVFGLCLTITNCANRSPHGLCRIRSPPCDLDCMTWDWDNQRCLGCVAGKEVWQGRCLVPIKGCAEYHPDNTCKNCLAGKRLEQGACVPSIDGCIAFYPNG